MSKLIKTMEISIPQLCVLSKEEKSIDRNDINEKKVFHTLIDVNEELKKDTQKNKYGVLCYPTGDSENILLCWFLATYNIKINLIFGKSKQSDLLKIEKQIEHVLFNYAVDFAFDKQDFLGDVYRIKYGKGDLKRIYRIECVYTHDNIKDVNNDTSFFNNFLENPTENTIPPRVLH